ncbi:MAG: hypothetical protein H7X95_12370, partial [Deltaproteobacteria bacterium]|nr:hypothetical protein [Deltaproteobacteria bacterium]
LKASRRDAELTRQMLLALRYVLPSKRPNRRRPRLAGRDFLDDALRLAELVSDAEATDATVIGRPILDVAGPNVRDGDALETSVDALAGDVPAAADGQSDDDLPPELESTLDRDRDRRRRRGRGDSRRFEEVRRPDEPGRADDAGRPNDAGRPKEDTGRRPQSPTPARQQPIAFSGPPSATTVSLAALHAALPPPLYSDRPRFLGTGPFGGPWSVPD